MEEPEFIGPIELEEMLLSDNYEKWSRELSMSSNQYGVVFYVRTLIENRTARMVVKLKLNSYFAVEGHVTDENELEGKSVIKLDSGFYVSACDDSDDCSYHSHFWNHDGNPITLVNTQKLPTFNDKTLNLEVKTQPFLAKLHKDKIEGWEYLAVSIRQLRVEEGWRRIYKNDALKLVKGNMRSSLVGAQLAITPVKEEEEMPSIDESDLDKIACVDTLNQRRLGKVFVQELYKHIKGEQEWKGQEICKKRLRTYNENFSEKELDTLTKMLTDSFSRHRNKD